MSEFLTAFRFLTILPLGKGKIVGPDAMASSMAYFPVVGAWLGVSLFVLDYALGKTLPVPVVSVLLIIFLALVTGGLHLDGFADTLDGLFGGGGDRARILDIMKDSRTGAAGVAGLTLLLLLKFEALLNLKGPARDQALIIMPMLARWSQVQVTLRAEYARKEGSLARPFVEFLEPRHFIAATVGAAAITLWVSGLEGLMPLAAVAAFALAAKHYFGRKIGGVTGDTIGAVSEVSEVLVLLLFLVMS